MKQKLYKLYAFVHSLKYPTLLKIAINSIFDTRKRENKEHIILAADWLVMMQNSDGGYSRKFSFINGRDASYIETTGYIIPSLMDAGEYLQERRYIDSALQAGEWLLEVQNSDGSFSEIDTHQPFAFDTGQCLIGLNYLFTYTKEQKYFNAAKKAAYWLFENQESDGSWQRVAYNRQKHTYYSRVASAMYNFGVLSDDIKLKDAAMKQIEWTLAQQHKNGYFELSSFVEGIPAYLHTLIYILEGLLDIYEQTQEKRVLNAILKNSEIFKNINLSRDTILCSQYDADFKCVNSERCMTGLAQWAGVALRLFEITKDREYKVAASNTLFYLKSKQLKQSSMQGGFTASTPFWGRYGSFEFVNWTNKFFIDSMLLLQKQDIKRVQEQESFVSSAFNVTSSVVTDTLSYMDRKYIKELEKILPKDKVIKVLDVGCGKGVIINYLKKSYPKISFYGIDPVFESENISQGTIYNIEFEDDSFDLVMSFEVLQHTYIEDALKELNRVTKKGGKLIIGERDPFSILGVLKPLLELTNRWMYPYDAPFKEQWYSKNEWKKLLQQSGFKMNAIKHIEGSGKPFVNRYLLIDGEVL